MQNAVNDDALVQRAVDQSALDLPGAVAAANELPFAKRRVALGRIAASWAARDVRTALDEAARIDDARTRAELIGYLTRALSAIDAEAMVAHAASLDAPDARTGAALQAFVELDSASAVELAATVPGSLGDMLERAALLKLSRNDPLASARHASAMPAGPERDAALRAAARGYARADPEAALVWAEQLDPRAPEAALAYRGRVPADAAPAWLAAVAAGYAHTDPHSARRWVADLRGQPGYERALAAVERQLAR